MSSVQAFSFWSTLLELHDERRPAIHNDFIPTWIIDLGKVRYIAGGFNQAPHAL